MRVSRIEFNGFRRLAQTATSIDGPLTAFVGFNEAGKTTLLRALDWFSRGEKMSPIDHNRSRPPASDSSAVVRVFFELDDADKLALADIEMDGRPASLILSRTSDGSRDWRLQPTPTRPKKVFLDASERLADAVKRLAQDLAASADDEDEDPNDWVAAVAMALEHPDADGPAGALDALASLGAWLREASSGQKRARDPRLADLLDSVRQLASQERPSRAVWNVLSARVPEFVLFQEADRLLETSYDIEPGQRARVDDAVLRLLALAEMELDQMWNYIQTDDSTRRATMLERGNDRLRSLFDQAWNQSKVTVRFNVNGGRLEVLIKELGGEGDVTNISERSDGLKTFVALVAFLEAGAYAVPPILLIDEAETHLHYDAQADLVSVLLKSVDTTQVFYTTHSPGCLPGDLGTGIRVLARDPSHADASIIKNNFWEGEGPGFSPLLFAMGAGAAAFSMCRNAVLAEGASDMVLLPTLIRQATGLSDLDYQIAPGLANAHGSGIRVEEVAAKVVYLTDGDQGGRNHAVALKAEGVDSRRIFSLSEGCAVEDLIEREDYITAVNGFLERMAQVKRVSDTDLPAGVPVATSLGTWAKASRVQIPSKVEMAYALLGSPDRRLTAAAKRSLAALHTRFMKAFEVTHG